ncbi:hypothetical protein AMQ83_04255 [Paenibacillus riograndensis]|nr:hypothetical protein AMQ83_04255 [Paenibacillus riograndensis]
MTCLRIRCSNSGAEAGRRNREAEEQQPGPGRLSGWKGKGEPVREAKGDVQSFTGYALGEELMLLTCQVRNIHHTGKSSFLRNDNALPQGYHFIVKSICYRGKRNVKQGRETPAQLIFMAKRRQDYDCPDRLFDDMQGRAY